MADRDHSSHQPHGSGIRGLSLLHIDEFDKEKARRAPEFEGRFSRMFNLEPFAPSEAALQKLAESITGDATLSDDPDPEESHIPAAYTYLGQFIDHDLTFDPSTFEQQKSDANAIVDFRTPRFDLDNVYGRGPADQPYMYDICVVPPATIERKNFLLGESLRAITRNPNAHDLPRAAANAAGSRRAIIGDPRNDENVIVSQLQGMLLRFHNAVATAMTKDGNTSFENIQAEVRWHYQWMVIHDFLPRVVARPILDAVSPAIGDPSRPLNAREIEHALKLYHYHTGVMPVEFAVAAYRFGHSMVRPGYRVNEVTPVLPIFDQNNPQQGLNAFGEFNKNWTIDWQRFLDIGRATPPVAPADRVQLAYKIDTSIVEPLTKLPASVAGAGGPFNLAFRNLLRGVKLHLPTGQAVAKEMKHRGVLHGDILEDSQILIGAAEDDAKDETTTGDGETVKNIAQIDDAFKGKCPLWVYVLAEARHNFFQGSKKAQLGAVGGRIVAETFLGILVRDRRSFVHQDGWKPRFGSNGTFTLADLLNTALQQ
jgi:hypothetical protein